MNKSYIQKLKRKQAKQNLALKMLSMNDNEIAKVIYKSSDQFTRSTEWKNLRKQAIDLYGVKCVYCGVLPTKSNPCNIDHIKPRKFFPELALDIANLQPLCAKCNKRKGNKH
jgi:5-methylcytosine-specific restriction endonuclease McrA